MTGVGLFDSFELGDLQLPNRIVMSPLTRNRVVPGEDAPRDIVAEHYSQRASAGLLITEGVVVSAGGRGYVSTPGIYSDRQVNAWRTVVDRVHDSGGRIMSQLWHVGRMSHPMFLDGYSAPVGPSPIQADAKVYLPHGSTRPHLPRELTTAEIGAIVEDFGGAARNARLAGFDGVEIHGSNGYLIDQFLHDGSNSRTDRYGGAIENRARLALEIVDAVTREFPASRVGMRIAPVSTHNDMTDSDPQSLFEYVVTELGRRGIGFIDVIEGQLGGSREFGQLDYVRLRELFGGAYISSNGHDRESAANMLASGSADLVSFGRAFIANPDLVERLRRGSDLNEPERSTFYFGGPRGYTDYPQSVMA
ncbi:alkene reductase [Gordonia desulfuricans]|uniref:Alkene reductase n=1 Tax=Gordonia desulfuricans TaxID=89051 RepID=A0A7K3LWH6_9ACTN|nr:alkene reductase [Gordonia desulfuricans]NDK92579.1 alkene reductase [Gordonia desulfuricans]